MGGNRAAASRAGRRAGRWRDHRQVINGILWKLRTGAPWRPGPGRPGKRPDVLIADKGYAHDSTRRALRQRGIRHVIPERSDQVARRAARGTAGGRPPTFDKAIYRKRNVVERCFNRLKQWRDLATRYAKRASLYRASLVLIAAIIWLP